MNKQSVLLILGIILGGCGDTVIRHSVEPGAQGEPGTSCSVAQIEQGALITCSDGTGAFVSHGVDGKDAELSGFTIVTSLDPCGDNPGEFDEILLVTSDGDYVAFFEAGGKRFLTVLECGTTYQTTDKQACLFDIDSECNYEEI